MSVIVMDASTAALAYFVLKPMRAAYLARLAGRSMPAGFGAIPT